MRCSLARIAVLGLLALISLAAQTDGARLKSVKPQAGASISSTKPIALGKKTPVPVYNNSRPLIGILSQPCDKCPGKSYVAAGYVKLIESAGGRAVPIRFYASDAELHRIFRSINGILFPGGLTWLWLDAPYVIAARKLFNWAVEANNAGNVFPLHGTCLGHQLLQILVSNISRNDLLVETDSVSHASTVHWTPAAATSRIFGTLSPDLKSAMSDPAHNIALENHMYGVPPAFYERTDGNFSLLKEWYKIVSTTTDRVGLEYISTIEGHKYPFTGTQWHPEKPPFEFGIAEIPHSLEAVRVSQHMANYFVNTARQSDHKPESLEEELALEIYDIPLVFSARFAVVEEGNYDGPDMTYYLDKREDPPIGPDDATLPEEAEGKEAKPAKPLLSASAAAAARKKEDMALHIAFWSKQHGMF